jgi:hypothetical protein
MPAITVSPGRAVSDARIKLARVVAARAGPAKPQKRTAASKTTNRPAPKGMAGIRKPLYSIRRIISIC